MVDSVAPPLTHLHTKKKRKTDFHEKPVGMESKITKLQKNLRLEQMTSTQINKDKIDVCVRRIYESRGV